MSLLPNNQVKIDTSSAADRAVLASLIEAIDRDPPLQHKLQTKMIEIAAGVEWEPPQASQLGDEQAQQMLRKLSQIKGIDLVTAPSIVSRSGQQATIEIINEVIAPDANAPNEMKTHNVGVVIDTRLAPLGFGHQVDLNFTDTTGGVNSKTGFAEISEHAAITNKGYTGDTGTQVQVQTHPDGSRTLLLITPTLLDATGKPAREQ
jgi:hypothetical protein